MLVQKYKLKKMNTCAGHALGIISKVDVKQTKRKK